MKPLKILAILLILAVIVIGAGFYLVHLGNAVAMGHKLIGLSTLFIFFIIMPAFIWVRYSKKDLSGFNLNKDKEKKDIDENGVNWD